MTTNHELGKAPSQVSNANPETDRLANLVKGLEEECAKLRQALAQLEAERNLYLKAVYANSHATLHFEDVDLPGLKTVDGIAEIAGNYPRKGRDERGAWFRDSEGNVLGVGQAVR